MKIDKETWVISSIVVAFVIGFVLLIAFTTKSKPAPGTPVSEALLSNPSSHMTGKFGAKAVVVEFGDFQCPACAAAYVPLKKLKGEYKDNPEFSFVFRHFPLPQHQNGMISSEAAEAAGAQGMFFEMHDLLYERQEEWSVSEEPIKFFMAYAGEIGLDVEKFRQDVESNKYTEVILKDKKDGEDLLVDHTPTIYVDGVEVDGYDFLELKARVDAALAK